jgi:hypothetical protein
MCSNLDMQALADCPESIRDTQELETFVAHAKTCLECRDRLRMALDFDRAFLEPFARSWHHLTPQQLKELRDSQFVPNRSEPDSDEEWHLVLCEDCARSFSQMTVASGKRAKIREVSAGWKSLLYRLAPVVIPGVVVLVGFVVYHNPGPSIRPQDSGRGKSPAGVGATKSFRAAERSRPPVAQTLTDEIKTGKSRTRQATRSGHLHVASVQPSNLVRDVPAAPSSSVSSVHSYETGSCSLTVAISGTFSTSPSVPSPDGTVACVSTGMTVITEDRGRVLILALDGNLYEARGRAEIQVMRDDVIARQGDIRLLVRLPRTPKLISVSQLPPQETSNTRVRGGSIKSVYPNSGAAVVPDEAHFRFDGTVGQLYDVEIQNEEGAVIHQLTTPGPSLDVPKGLLKPGRRYYWTVKPASTGAPIVGGKFVTLNEEQIAWRSMARLDLAVGERSQSPDLVMAGSSIAWTTSPARNSASYLQSLLAVIDFGLGLVAEARDELRAVASDVPTADGARRILTMLNKNFFTQ